MEPDQQCIFHMPNCAIDKTYHKREQSVYLALVIALQHSSYTSIRE